MAIMNNVCRHVLKILIANKIGYILYKGEGEGEAAIAIKSSDACWTPILFTSYTDVRMDKLFCSFSEINLVKIRGYKEEENYSSGKNHFDCGEFFGSSYRDGHSQSKAVASFLAALTNYQPSGCLRREDYW